MSITLAVSITDTVTLSVAPFYLNWSKTYNTLQEDKAVNTVWNYLATS